MLEVKQVSLTDVLKGKNARSRVLLSYLGVRKEVANCEKVKREKRLLLFENKV